MVQPPTAVGVSPLALIHAICNTPDLIHQIKDWCAVTEKKEVHQPVSSPIFLWRIFWAAGSHVFYAETVERLEQGFRKNGWRMLPATAALEPADIYIQATDGILTNIGIVVKVSGESNWFLGMDGTVTEPWRPFKVEKDSAVYFMRCGCKYK